LICLGYLRSLAYGDSNSFGSYEKLFKYKGIFIQSELRNISSKDKTITIANDKNETFELK